MAFVRAFSLTCLVLLCPLTLLFGQEVKNPTPTPPPEGESTRRPLVYPDSLILTPKPDGSVLSGDLFYSEHTERVRKIVPTTVGEEVELTGHIERIDGQHPIVLGREIDTTFSKIKGGWRKSLVPGALVKVQGKGAGTGPVRADSVEIIPMTDPELDYKLAKATDKFKNKFFKKAHEFNDAGVTAYLREIGQRLMPFYAAEDYHKFYYHVVKDPVANAFVLPDGTVVVHTGLIALLDNEAELAAVLGHEFAHWTQRHAARMASKQTEHTLLSIGSMIASIALGTLGDADKQQAAKGIELMTSAYFSGYSRDFEDEADLAGMRYLYLGGYDVREAPKVWETFRMMYGDEDELVNVFYGTHSTSKQRQFLLTNEVNGYYGTSGGGSGRIGLEDFETKMAPVYRENAILLMEKGYFEWAELQLRKAIQGNPKDSLAYVKLGDVLLKLKGSKGKDEALIAYRRALELNPESKEAKAALEKLGK